VAECAKQEERGDAREPIDPQPDPMQHVEQVVVVACPSASIRAIARFSESNTDVVV
jgi:hypothetical protein